MLVLGIDVGTTGTKAFLMDGSGKIIGQGYKGYQSFRGTGGIVEQDAEDWWKAVQESVRMACSFEKAKQLKAISLSTQGASSLIMDEKGIPQCRAITWMDSRALPQKEELENARGSDWFYEKTGWPLNVSLDATKALWIKEEKPNLSKGNLFVSTQEFIHFKLTGKAIIDSSNAAMRQMMNLKNKKWDQEILELVGLSESFLPEIIPSGEYIGKVTAEAAEKLGIPKDVSVYNGAHDQYCCALGSGSVSEGDTFLGTGTAWALMHNSKDPLFTKSKIAPGPHIIPDLWGALSTVPCAGMAFDWVKNQVIDREYDAIDQAIKERLGKNDSLLFYPYFTGVGFPQWDNQIRGTVVGLELQHDGMDLALSVMEGIAFQTATLIDEYRKVDIKIPELRVMGGAGKSLPWMEILAAVTGCEINLVQVSDASPMGAAMIAAVGSGLFKNYKEAASILSKAKKLPAPDKALCERYQEKQNAYMKRFSDIKKLYEERRD